MPRGRKPSKTTTKKALSFLVAMKKKCNNGAYQVGIRMAKKHSGYIQFLQHAQRHNFVTREGHWWYWNQKKGDPTMADAKKMHKSVLLEYKEKYYPMRQR